MDPEPRIDQKKPHVVFIPYPAQSHIKCMLKLARLLHHKGIHITFVNTESNQKRLLKYGGFHGLDTAPDFQFKTVPDGLPSDDDTDQNQTAEQLFLYLLTNFSDSFLDLVTGLENPPTCIISDGFMTFTNNLYAAEKLKIPIILYWTLAACGFMAYYQTKVLTDKGILPLKDESYLENGYTDTVMDWIPGMEGIRLKDLPKHMLATSPDGSEYNILLEVARTAHKVSHMIIHTFDELESSLITELKLIFPRIYTVGPQQLLLNQVAENESASSSSNGYSLWKEEPECIEWLESKEPNSVVYVNFGSLAVMSLQDLLELGWGLVNSNHYFLWIIRTDMVDGGATVLPPEFEAAIKTRGFIRSWCSQEEVLNHPSIGGFLTHGGWGSVIESLSAGVPMLCWPVSHDQGVNCKQMCRKWEVAMEIEKKLNRYDVEKLVKALMEGIEGKRMREKAMEWKKMAEIAADCNGSSSLNINELANEIINFSRN
ncbi:hypothetical protein L1887_20270 [Cichorium endivia]|nr:hypothetical protein L1887_20270 [Cichorium endivia]